MFTLRKKNGNLLVRYTFKPVDSNKTELEYYVSTENSELDESFIKSIVEKLKIVLEK